MSEHSDGQPEPTRPLPDQPPAYPGAYGQQPPSYPPPQYGQPPQYGAPQGYPPPPAGYHYAQPEDPGAQTSLIVGILGLAIGFLGCGLGFIASPFALVLGIRSKGRIDASGGRLGGRSNAQAGFVMGLIGTILLALAILAVMAFVALIVFGVITSDTFDDSTYDYGTSA